MAYNNRLDDDVMDDQSTEHTAVAFLKTLSQQQTMTLQPLLFCMTIPYLQSWRQMKKST